MTEGEFQIKKTMETWQLNAISGLRPKKNTQVEKMVEFEKDIQTSNYYNQC